MFKKKVVEKVRTHSFYSVSFPPPKSCRLWDNVEKCARAKQPTDDSIIQRMCFACWITKATDTYSEYVILIAFLQQQWLHKHA